MWDVAEMLSGEKVMGERWQRKYATWTDALKAEGREEGLAQGLEKGLEKGLAQGREEKLLALSSVLKNLLAKRFGEIPSSIRPRIESADEELVTCWIARALDAKSIDEVFPNKS